MSAETDTENAADSAQQGPTPAQSESGTQQSSSESTEEDASSWSRRSVLQTTGALAVGAGTVSAATAKSNDPPFSRRQQEVRTVEPLSSDDPFEQPGHPSRDAYRALAESEREHQMAMREVQQQQGGGEFGSPTAPNFSNVINAVEDLGADPTGNEPVDGIINSNSDSGNLLVFPNGTYKLAGKVQASADGTFGMVGEGWQNANGPPDPSNGAVFVAPPGQIARINYSAQSGVLGNFVLDQSNTNASISFVVGSSGFTEARDIAITGVVDDTGSAANEAANKVGCALIANEGATARVTRYVSIGTGLPGDKNDGGVPAIWVGDGNRGTAQIVSCVVESAADNGIYGSRTSGDTQIVGGRYSNNEVTQIRYCGQGSFADGVTLVFDADNYQGPTSGYQYNERYGVNPVKIEQPSHISKPGGAILRNADVQALSKGQSGGGAVIFIRGHGGALKMENCRIVDALPMQTVYAEAPGSSYDPASPPPHNITMNNCLVEGNDPNDIIRIEERGNSAIIDTCIQIPGAGPQSISGASTTNVGYGENCTQAQGLSDPSLVGSSNLSNISIPAGNFSSPGDGGGGIGFDPVELVSEMGEAIVDLIVTIVAAVLFMFLLLILIAIVALGLIRYIDKEYFNGLLSRFFKFI